MSAIAPIRNSQTWLQQASDDVRVSVPSLPFLTPDQHEVLAGATTIPLKHDSLALTGINTPPELARLEDPNPSHNQTEKLSGISDAHASIEVALDGPSKLDAEIDLDHHIQLQLPTPGASEVNGLATKSDSSNTQSQATSQREPDRVSLSGSEAFAVSTPDARKTPSQTQARSIEKAATRSPGRHESNGLPKSQTSRSPAKHSSYQQHATHMPLDYDLRAKASIPPHLNPWDFARQGSLAAYASRLNPFALHTGEYALLRKHITLAQVTVYLNIRNAILRLWVRSPMIPVRLDEAIGCARESRYFPLAEVAYNWLVRNGYINFGCVEIPASAKPQSSPKSQVGRSGTIVVIGAGMSGLGCARQLTGLLSHYGHRWLERGERPPRVVVLEGRQRLGGRVYSHMLRGQRSTLPDNLRATAEMGAQIVTGFEHGNPMNVLIRGQLGLRTYALKDNSILYDTDGREVDTKRDQLAERLYNDVLERASVFRNVPKLPKTIEGDRLMIQQGKDPTDEGGKTLLELEEDGVDLKASNNSMLNLDVPKQAAISTEKLPGRAYQIAGTSSRAPAAEAAQSIGYSLRDGIVSADTLALKSPNDSSIPGTLGDTMDDALMQYQKLIHLTPQDLRLFNWHNANLEYANAAKVGELSLTGWDQDLGNEFEGAHSEVVGGYQQVPLGLEQSPSPLDVQFGRKVCSVTTTEGKTKVRSEDGQEVVGDHVVISVPLGVLKAQSIKFTPDLPESKSGAIDRLGFGLLNKVIMVYDKAFWEPDRDMFGLLNQASSHDSMSQSDYTTTRGRFFLFWNCIKTSGRPTLVALMAGDSAHQAERETNEALVQDLTARLRKMFGSKVPLPTESIVTRWKKDPFARGSYSYVGPATRADDYEVMAAACGNVHFAGEATCGTHPATVHGAYLSGLRAAAEIVESLLGPIHIPTPLVPPATKTDTTPRGTKRPHYETIAVPINPIRLPSKAEEYEASIIGAILAEVGQRPLKPAKQGINPFLLYQKDHWYSCKAICDAEAQRRAKNMIAKAGRTEIRTALGHQWRTATEEVKKPYLEKSQAGKTETANAIKLYEEQAKAWDREAARIRHEYIDTHPPPAGVHAKSLGRTSIELGRAKLARSGGGNAEMALADYQVPLFDHAEKLPL